MKNTLESLLIVVFLVLFGGISAVAQDTGISWYQMEEAQQLAKENGKKVLVYAEVSWCSYCRKMEQQVLSKYDIQTKMNKYFIRYASI